jgi:hypothetical protein
VIHYLHHPSLQDKLNTEQYQGVLTVPTQFGPTLLGFCVDKSKRYTSTIRPCCRTGRRSLIAEFIKRHIDFGLAENTDLAQRMPAAIEAVFKPSLFDACSHE